jgi:uncharacterized membrane protein
MIDERHSLVPANQPPLSPQMRRLAAAVDWAVLNTARHWLLALGVVSGLYAGLPLLGPWLLSQGLTIPGRIIYLFYRVLCHQLPERSFVVFGHQMCYCERCCAIYSGFFGCCLLYALLPLRRLRPLNWRFMLLFWAPMALDGGTQLLGLRESTWELRVITGLLFAISSAWVALPHLAQACAAMRRDLEARRAGGTLTVQPET